MSSMSKLLMSVAVSTLIAQASSFNLESFLKNTLIKNPFIKIEKVDTVSVQPLKNRPDWKAYMFVMKIKLRGKEQTVPDTIFINEKEQLATTSLIDLKTGEKFRETMRPTLPKSYYNKEHLILGNPNAPHKIVVFTDPQCPFCKEFIPKLIKDVKANPDKLALYYYHMPLLRLHPASDTITKVMAYLVDKGQKDKALEMYKLKIDPRMRDEKKILAEIKKQLNIDVKPSDINNPKYKKEVKDDLEKGFAMMVRGTPTVYFDGKYDEGRAEYKKVIK